MAAFHDSRSHRTTRRFALFYRRVSLGFFLVSRSTAAFFLNRPPDLLPERDYRHLSCFFYPVFTPFGVFLPERCSCLSFFSPSFPPPLLFAPGPPPLSSTHYGMMRTLGKTSSVSLLATATVTPGRSRSHLLLCVIRCFCLFAFPSSGLVSRL